VAPVRADVSEKCISSIIKMERIRELGTLAVTRTSQKMAFFLVAAVKTSNPTFHFGVRKTAASDALLSFLTPSKKMLG
jgi:hypothetical protein